MPQSSGFAGIPPVIRVYAETEEELWKHVEDAEFWASGKAFRIMAQVTGSAWYGATMQAIDIPSTLGNDQAAYKLIVTFIVESLTKNDEGNRQKKFSQGATTISRIGGDNSLLSNKTHLQ